MRTMRNLVDANEVCDAWAAAGRPANFNTFSRQFRARKAAEAAAAEAAAPRVELWIRQKGLRRQAFWREAGTVSWDWVEITKADRAEREGYISVGPFVDAKVVMYEEAVQQ